MVALRNSARIGSSIWNVAPLPTVELDPDATAVHLDDLLGDGEAEPGSALGLGVGVVHLVELVEHAGQLVLRDARAGVGDS